MADQETLAKVLAELREALLRGQLDPENEQSALRRGLRLELQAQLGTAGIEAFSRPANGGHFSGDSKVLPQSPKRCSDYQRISADSSHDQAVLAAAEAHEEAGGHETSLRTERSADALQHTISGPNQPSLAPSEDNSISGRTLQQKRSNKRVPTDLVRKTSSLPDAPLPPPGKKGARWLLHWMRIYSHKLTRKGYGFDVFMGLIIMANSLSVGLELQWDLEGNSEYMSLTRGLEHVFLVMFVLEIIIRGLADGKKSLKSPWFRFDVILVAIGAVSSWLVEPALGSSTSQASDLISQLLIMRVLRLLRLIRALRLVELFQDLWKLVNGLMGSIRTVLSACSLVMLTIYVFACLGIELITRNVTLLGDPVTAEVVQEHFPSLQVTMLTLVQFANADSIADVYTPLILKVWYLAFYFSAVWLVVTVSLMNLVTAVIVDNAIEHGGMDREMQNHALRKRLRALEPHIKVVFRELDSSGNGRLSLEECQDGLRTMEHSEMWKLIPEDLQRVLDAEKLADLFEFLDITGSGEINHQEFFDGICHLMLESVPIETTQTLQLLRSQSRTLQLMRSMTCLHQECTTLATDYVGGESFLSVVSGPAIQVGSFEVEQGLLQHSFFQLPLSEPLVENHSAGSRVSVHPQLRGPPSSPYRCLADRGLEASVEVVGPQV